MAEAMHIMPQGVAENYRFWGEDKTVFVEKTKGCEFWDVDGKKYATMPFPQCIFVTLWTGTLISGWGTALSSLDIVTPASMLLFATRL
jgi:hypothetical protein